MTLQRFSRITFAIVAALLVAMVTTLSISTWYTSNLNQVHARTLANVSAALSMEVALFEYNRDSNILLYSPAPGYDEAREQARHEISVSLDSMVRQTEPEDAALVAGLAAAIRTYFATRARLDAKKAPAYPEVVSATEPSFLQTNRLIHQVVNVNRLQSTAAFARAAYWDRVADAGALALVFAFLVLGTWYVSIFSRRVYAPLTQIRGALDSYAADNATRLPEQGFAEVRQIASAFNALAASQQALKQRQLSTLAGVAHDLKTPLTTIKGYLELYKSQHRALTDDATRIVSQQVDRLTSMVQDLLDAQLIEAGQMDLRKAWHDARAVLGEAVAAFRDIAPQHTFSVAVPAEAVRCYCDALRMAQVLNNLLSNAVKYSPRGGTIRVSMTVEGNAVTVGVEDEGLGIAATDLERIFLPFQRGGGGGQHIPGSGLGLATTKKIVEAHGGTIRVASVQGKGSRFEFTLPMR